MASLPPFHSWLSFCRPSTVDASRPLFILASARADSAFSFYRPHVLVCISSIGTRQGRSPARYEPRVRGTIGSSGKFASAVQRWQSHRAWLPRRISLSRCRYADLRARRRHSHSRSLTPAVVLPLLRRHSRSCAHKLTRPTRHSRRQACLLLSFRLPALALICHIHACSTM